MQKALVLGGGGFIGSHLVKRLKSRGYYVVAVDLKRPDFSDSSADEFIVDDLRNPSVTKQVIRGDENEIYQLAAEMGGAGFIFTGENDASVMHNSATINLNVLDVCAHTKPEKIFFASSACIYPEHNQTDPGNPNCEESSAYPAQPDSEYGWEKLFSERMYLAYARNHGLNVRIARFHNVYGPESVFDGGREKAPAAICRKVALAANPGHVEVWGDGLQTRSFLFIDDCLDGVDALMRSEYAQPLNIGSEEMIAMNDFTRMVAVIAGKNISIMNVKGPLGVRGRRSDNSKVTAVTGWNPRVNLMDGMKTTYRWIEAELDRRSRPVSDVLAGEATGK
jgi:nucleoside-diphosphate-sugar epimerase